jgi:hypothetical protein
MFWQRQNSDRKLRRPSLTGTGAFIANLDWWLWDDAASPGLLSIERFEKLRKLALTPDEHKRLSILLIRGQPGSRALPEDAKFVDYAMRVGNYLTQIRMNDFDQLDYWLGFDFMLHDDGWVKDQNGVNLTHDILRVVAAYVNCLELWGFEYTWCKIHDGANKPALLLYRNGEPRYCLSQAEVDYVQGKPYRFSIITKLAAWHFNTNDNSFEICPRGSGEPCRF